MRSPAFVRLPSFSSLAPILVILTTGPAAIAWADQPPVVSAPANVTVAEGQQVCFNVTATDPDGDPISFCTVSGNPPGSSLTANPGGATFCWTPSFTSAGTYTITFTCCNALCGSATTILTVNNVNRAPAITVPGNLTQQEGTAVNLAANATDPDAGDAITMTQTGMPTGLTFTPSNGNPASATITGTLSFTSEGTYNIVWTATDNGSPVLSASGTTVLTVIGEVRIFITVPANLTRSEGDAVNLTATATDSDASRILTMTQTGKPASLTFTASNGNPASATITGPLSFTSAGTYNIVWTATDNGSPVISASGTTALTVNNVNRAPVITVPVNLTRCEGTAVNLTATASDPDAGDTITMTQTGKPASLTFTPTNGNPASATITGTLSFTDAVGSPYTIVWTATDNGTPNLSASGTTVLTIPQANLAPVITVPANLTHSEGQAVTLTATATDGGCAGDILTITQTGKPAGLTFTQTSGNPASATITGTLSFTDGGTTSTVYPIVWTATDNGSPNLSASGTTNLTVNNVNRVPVITVPADLTRLEGQAVSITATATDADAGDTITMTQTGKPASLTFASSNGNPASATIAGTPAAGSADSSPYNIVWTATDNGSPMLSASGTTVLTINICLGCPPPITASANTTQNEGTAVSLAATATDIDATDILTITQTGKPASLTFTSTPGVSPRTATITGTLSFTDGNGNPSVYNIVWTMDDGRGFTASATTVLTVNNVNRDPVSQPGGPYAGIIGLPLSFDGNTSFDPDGEALTYEWDFDASDGILVESTEQFPVHAYVSGTGSPFTVTLTVRDPLLASNTATTLASVSGVVVADCFVTGGNKSIRLEASKPFWCAQVQPHGASYSNSDVMLNTIRLTFETGSILAVAGKTVIATDRNGDGVQEITACFAKADLRTLFASVPSGRSTQTVRIGADLNTGGHLECTMEVEVVKSGATLSATISPNPLNPEAMLVFRTTGSGFARVRVYDLAGRLVQSLMDEPNLAPGYHEVSIRGRGADGEELASGIYFYRIEAAEGVTSGRFTILR